MQVTGRRVAAAAEKKAKKDTTASAPKTKAPARFEDGFDAPVKKTKGPKQPPGPKVQVGPAFLEAGRSARERDATAGEALMRSAAQLLGGLTVSIVVGVLHEFQVEASGAAQRLGALTGALFLEYLAVNVQPDAVSVVDELVSAGARFGQRFEQSFGMSPLEATRRFVDFIGQTEGQPRRRLAGTIYG